MRQSFKVVQKYWSAPLSNPGVGSTQMFYFSSFPFCTASTHSRVSQTQLLLTPNFPFLKGRGRELRAEDGLHLASCFVEAQSEDRTYFTHSAHTGTSAQTCLNRTPYLYKRINYLDPRLCYLFWTQRCRRSRTFRGRRPKDQIFRNLAIKNGRAHGGHKECAKLF
jgi:hypothetical protein